MHRWLTRVVILCLATIILVASATRILAADVKITCLISDELKSTTRALAGARKVITRKYPDAQFETLLLDGHDGLIVDSVRKINPSVVLSIGSSATRYAQEHFSAYPVVFSSVKYPVLSGFVESIARPGGEITGASLNIPEDVQFKYFKKIVPDLKKVGVLYTANTAPLITQARIVAKRLGLQLIPVLVEKFRDLPLALDSLIANTDGIWSVADPQLFGSKSTKYIITRTLRTQIPLMGFSRNLVASGALFSLDFDYKAVGFQAGEIVNRVLAGEKPAQIPVSSSDLIWFHYNEKTAQHINITVPDELTTVAKEVYR